AGGEPFPAPDRVGGDIARMRAVGINAMRTYHVPPAWFLRLADEHGMAAFIDVPWAKHLCFLDSAQAHRDARQAGRPEAPRGRGAELGRGHAGVSAYSAGNETPPDVIRWQGARRVERFLAELRDVAKQADPAGLVTYASYPPTEYLELPFLDFATFNVYLHDP